MQAGRASALALGFSLVGVVLAVLLIGVAAGAGPAGVVHGTPHDAIFHAPTVAPTSSPSPVGRGGSDLTLPHGGSSLPHAGLIGLVLRLALAAWLLTLLWRGLGWLADELQSRRRHESPPLDVDFDVLDDPEPLLEEMRRDADGQLELLLSGEPRNAIVVCWERFEEQAERVGLSRKPWETSSEFTLRLLDVVSADPQAVSRLAGLYREARFSRHEITETQRQEAVEAVRRIQATIGPRVGAVR
jgi:hypothetical protein